MTRPLSPDEKRNKIEYFIKKYRETRSFPVRDSEITQQDYNDIVRVAESVIRRNSENPINLSGGRRKRVKRTRRKISKNRKTKRRHSSRRR
jgi:hypothetical protein